MKKYLILLTLSVVLLDFAAPIIAYAQEDATISQLYDILQVKVNAINKWNFHAMLLTVFAVVVGLLGAVGGILSHVKKKWAKVIVSVAGACVAIITVIVNTVYPVDYRTYRKMAYNASQIVEDMRFQIKEIQSIHDKKTRDEIINKTIKPALKELTAIGEKLYACDSESLIEVATAFAQQAVPEWVTKPPKDAYSLYFVGSGVSTKLDDAERSAIDYAKETARISLLDTLIESGQSQANPSNDRIIQSILDSSEVVKKFVAAGGQPKQYRYFCLLKIDIELAQIRLKLLASQGNITIPENYIDLLKKKNMTK